MGRGLVVDDAKTLNVGLSWLMGFLGNCRSERKKGGC